jgi:hyperosmotically inducible protein
VGGFAAPACPIITDQVIAANVASRLSGAVSSPAYPVSISVQNGIVTMVGTVIDDRRVALATFLAQTVPGVTTINNKLVVNSPVALDVRLAGTVKEAINKQPFDTTQVRVVVNEGVVTLRGMVDSDFARDMLAVAAEGVQGVTAVHNNLIVRNPGDNLSP